MSDDVQTSLSERFDKVADPVRLRGDTEEAFRQALESIVGDQAGWDSFLDFLGHYLPDGADWRRELSWQNPAGASRDIQQRAYKETRAFLAITSVMLGRFSTRKNVRTWAEIYASSLLSVAGNVYELATLLNAYLSRHSVAGETEASSVYRDALQHDLASWPANAASPLASALRNVLSRIPQKASPDETTPDVPTTLGPLRPPRIVNVARWQAEIQAKQRRICRFIGAVHGRADTMGTGLLVGPDLVLTASHSVRRGWGGGPPLSWPAGMSFACQFDYVGAKGPDTAPIAVVGSAPVSERHASSASPFDSLDYVVLRLAEPVGKERGYESLLDAVAPDIGEIVLLFQHAGGAGLSVSSGVVRGVRLERFSHDAPSAPGASGGAVYTWDLRLVGIHSMKEFRTNLGWATLGSAIEATLSAGPGVLEGGSGREESSGTRDGVILEAVGGKSTSLT